MQTMIDIRNRCSRTLLVLLALTISSQAVADSFDGTIDLFEASASVKPFFQDAYGYVVFPTIGKGGFVVGGAYGKGKVYVNDRVTGTVTMTKVSIGLQMGGQAFSEVIFLKDKRAFDEFTAGSYEFDATASAVVITAGAQVQSGTSGNTAGASAGPATGAHMETTYTKGMAIFVHALGGLMYEAAIGGQKFKYKPLDGSDNPAI
jgi:lipid-binding SYLF domain-containing protein